MTRSLFANASEFERDVITWSREIVNARDLETRVNDSCCWEWYVFGRWLPTSNEEAIHGVPA